MQVALGGRNQTLIDFAKSFEALHAQLRKTGLPLAFFHCPRSGNRCLNSYRKKANKKRYKNHESQDSILTHAETELNKSD